jgi:transposase-like protein
LDGCDALVSINSKIEHSAWYHILGGYAAGKKKLLGRYISQSEGANFWFRVLSVRNNNRLTAVLIACTDNLKGFSETILSIFPKTQIQKCIGHQLRNALK